MRETLVSSDAYIGIKVINNIETKYLYHKLYAGE